MKSHLTKHCFEALVDETEMIVESIRETKTKNLNRMMKAMSCEQESVWEEREQCSQTEQQQKTEEKACEKYEKTSKTFALSSGIIKLINCLE